MTNRTLVIGNKNYSSWSMRPWLLLKVFEIPFEEIRIPLMTDEMPALMTEHSPSRKVPVLNDGDLQIWDSLAICEYIDEQLLKGEGWPANARLRALGRSAAAEMHSGFFALRNELPMNGRRLVENFVPSSAAQTDIDRIISLWQQLLNESKGPFLLGAFSIADAFYAPVVSRFITYGVQLPEQCVKYCQQVSDLPAYQQWRAEGAEEPEVIEIAEV